MGNFEKFFKSLEIMYFLADNYREISIFRKNKRYGKLI